MSLVIPPEHPSVVIVGRPNVGKSTLFNRITSSRRAIVGDEPGITRDRIRLAAEWNGRRFDLVDTGGMMFHEEDEFPVLISRQVKVAIEAASHVIFVVDGRSEISSGDRDLADLLRRSGKPVTLAVNKCDTAKHDKLTAGFYELGITDVFPISAEHDLGMADLLDHVTAGLAETVGGAEPPTERPIKVAIIGRPNVGKSTLLNRLTGQERSIVSPTPGTTRDAVDEEVMHDGVPYIFVDTAGIRRKGKTKQMAEKLSVVMAQRHIRLADVALVLIDGAEGVTALDATIAGYADQAGKALILVVNKWDQVPPGKQRKFKEQIPDKLKFLEYAPAVYISALTGSKVRRLFPLIGKVHRAANRRVQTAELNRFVETVDFERATSPGGRKPKIHYVTQATVAPPTFVFFTNRAEKFHFAFERFLLNQLRKRFDFEGTPIVIKCRLKRR
jgi:GTP-binding protein